ncbi:secreted RxLR effector protein 161-like [Miscanthus floridulus]|uniref:secreted RxLR effector protein 161-like n=1 Tax=Miscanthus floridulus TaxID=154761 RepID=UPI00345967EF
MATRFQMSDLGALSYYLGIEVRQEKEAFTLGQSTYVSKLFEQSGMLSASLHTRLDIMFVVGYVNRFMEDLREDHWATVKRLLRYIKGTVDQGIVFPKTGRNRLQLTVFSDTDMTGDIDAWRSTSGVLIFLGSAPISWLSLKQKVVALFTCEADYVTAATTTCQAVWLR